MADIPERYSRQVRFAGLGEEGQRRLMASRVTLVGCGALGTVLANSLVRAGVGYLR
jgi:adenylyltransferase/sulfurtransferase